MTNNGRNAVDVLLAESFKELVVQQPIDKITIKAITDKAGVIRPTFYNHFQDKYELLEWIITTELLEPAGPLIQNGMIDEALVLIFTSISKEKEFYMRASRLEGQNSFDDIVKGCITNVLLSSFEVHSIDEKDAVAVAYERADSPVSCAVDVVYGNELDSERNDNAAEGNGGYL